MATCRLTLAPPIRKRSGIGRVVEDGADRGVRSGFPEELACTWSDRVSAREENLFAMEVLHHLATTAQSGKLLEDEGDDMADLLIWVFDDPAIAEADQASR